MKNKIVPILLIIIAVAAAYSSALQCGFVWDDEHLILKNEFIKDWHKIPEIFTTNLHHFDRSGSNFYRPFVALSFMASYAMFGLKPSYAEAHNNSLRMQRRRLSG